MKKRQLSNKQKNNIKNREIKIKEEVNLNSNREKAIVITRYGNTAKVKTETKQTVVVNLKRTTDQIVTGDQVIIEFEDNYKEGKIIATLERNNELSRPYQKTKKIIAANIDQMLIVNSINPKISLSILDNYLIAAESLKINPVIIINKIDLCSAKELQEIKKDMQIYQNIGYDILYYSNKTKDCRYKRDNILEKIIDKSNILVGQSGVGKSTIIKEIFPEIDIKIQEISKKSNLGRHTTTYSTLFEIEKGGSIIDSPGIREFKIGNIPKEEIANLYRDFQPYIKNCKFRNCNHINPPNCGIKEALKNKEISEKRYNNYIKIHENTKQ